jgi:hypothetical protein
MFYLSRGTQIPEYVLQGCLAAFKSRNRPSLFVLKSRTETDARKEDSVIFVLISDLSHFRCRLGGSTRRKSLYPRSLGTVYRPFGRSRFSLSAVRGLMDATPVCSTGWRCATVSRLHRKCGRSDLSAARHLFPCIVFDPGIEGSSALSVQLRTKGFD